MIKDTLSPAEVAKVRKLKEARKLNIKEVAVDANDFSWLTAKILALNAFAIKLAKKVEETPIFEDTRQIEGLKIKLTASDRMHKTLEQALSQAIKDKKK